ncbi:MAG: hypothetical protein HY817_03750 [Candidatus Abawacabacteria bacterium]|nr:hypothetical protein [Candidatus Abawacabacteria bacterium]
MGVRLPDNPPEHTASPEKPSRRRFLHAIFAGAAVVSDSAIRRHIGTLTEEKEAKRERLPLVPGKSLIEQLRSKDIFPVAHEWSVAASAEAFVDIGQSFLTIPAARDLRKQEVIKILCPASGYLISPLEIAFTIAQEAPDVKCFEYTMTEIGSKYFESIDEHIRRLVEHGTNFSDLHITIEQHPEVATGAKRKLITFECHLPPQRKVLIKINFELNMSGETYYRHEAARESDIWVFHDLGEVQAPSGVLSRSNEAKGEVYIMVDHASRGSLTNKRHFWVNQLTPSPNDPAPLGSYLRRNPINYQGVAAIRARSDKHPYGCGHNHFDSPGRRARASYWASSSTVGILEVDTRLLQIVNNCGGEYMLQIYAMLLQSERFDEYFPYETFEQNSLPLIDQFITKLSFISDHEAQDTLFSVAQSYLLAMRNEVMRAKGEEKARLVDQRISALRTWRNSNY